MMFLKARGVKALMAFGLYISCNSKAYDFAT